MKENENSAAVDDSGLAEVSGGATTYEWGKAVYDEASSLPFNGILKKDS